MKSFAIRDGYRNNEKNLAYLMYFESTKKFYGFLPKRVNYYETPLVFSSFAKRGKTVMDSYWSYQWVSHRIIPRERQNLAEILKRAGMHEYDEFKLLTRAGGRCAQDDYYIVKTSADEIIEDVFGDEDYRVKDVLVSWPRHVIVFFRNGKSKRCSLTELCKGRKEAEPVLAGRGIFEKAEVLFGGLGIGWGESLEIMCDELYKTGESLNISLEDINCYIRTRTETTGEAMQRMNCSRQNIDDLVKRKKAEPVKSDAQGKLFSKAELLARTWK